ncbi:MAG TPA: type IV secretion system DNA-binding domain-containing protein [Solirubrobacteraceae bacterium]|nr:type IV secretion system DNA-binding domain-containing protein [Solirubrobacteraceae bacterium]
MPSTDQTPDPGVEFITAMHELAHWLLSTIAHGVLGLALGWLAAEQLHRRRLHWSWAAGALVVVIVAHDAFAGLTLTLLLAALVAMSRTRRAQRDSLQRAATLTDGAYRPLDAVAAFLRKTFARHDHQQVSDWFRGEDLVLGHDQHGQEVLIPLGGATGGTHTLVVGAAGSGKTVTQTWVAIRAIERGMAAVVVDPKGDRDLRDQLRIAAQAAGRRFIEWTPDGHAVYNPYANGSATEIADKLLAGERFTEPHYLRQAQRYLGHEVRALRTAGLEVSLARLVSHLDPARLELLARELPEADADVVHAYLDSLTPRQRADLAGVRDRLAILAESDVGPWLDPGAPDAEPFDLLEAIKARAVVYFSLESERLPLLSQMLAAAIVQDLLSATTSLQTAPTPSLVVIDEFSALAAEHVARLFARARSAGMSIVLGTQELADMRLPGREGLLEQTLGNLSALIVHRQVVPASTELIANVAGTADAWNTSSQSDGRVTYKRGLEYLIHPNEIKRLQRGHAAVIRLVDGSNVRVARVLSAAQHP